MLKCQLERPFSTGNASGVNFNIWHFPDSNQGSIIGDVFFLFLGKSPIVNQEGVGEVYYRF